MKFKTKRSTSLLAVELLILIIFVILALILYLYYLYIPFNKTSKSILKTSKDADKIFKTLIEIIKEKKNPAGKRTEELDA